MILFFLLVLTGALVQTQSGVFATARTSDAQMRSREACRSIYDYCLYQIEHHRDWGKGGFQSLEDLDPVRSSTGSTAHLGDRIALNKADGNRFYGYLPELNASFRVEVINALTSPGTVSGTPPEHITLSIAAWSGKSEAPNQSTMQSARATLRLAPLYDASILTRGDLRIDSNHLFISSKDGLRNELRAEGDASLPGLTSGHTKFTDYHPDLLSAAVTPADVEVTGTGLLWSGADIKENNVTLEQEELALAARSAGARMVNEATNRLDVYDLQPENIPQPESSELNADVIVPPGEFRFTKAMMKISFQEKIVSSDGFGGTTVSWHNREVQRPYDILEYHPPDSNDEPTQNVAAPFRGDPEMLEVRNVQMELISESSEEMEIPTDPSDPLDPTDPGVTIDPGIDPDPYPYPDPESETEPPPLMVADRVALRDPGSSALESGIARLDSGQSSPVYFDMNSQALQVQSKTRIRPKDLEGGDPSGFHITSKAGVGNRRPNEPTFSLGAEGNDVIIEAEGDITLGAGLVSGLGTVISKQGNVNIQSRFNEIEWVQEERHGRMEWVARKRVVRVDPHENYEGLVVYAGQDVNISSVSNVDWQFRGFIYARRNFNFDVGGNKALFFGSVIAGKDSSNEVDASMQITNGDRLAFVYDPEYLKLMTKALPNNWTRVERLIWSES